MVQAGGFITLMSGQLDLLKPFKMMRSIANSNKKHMNNTAPKLNKDFNIFLQIQDLRISLKKLKKDFQNSRITLTKEIRKKIHRKSKYHNKYLQNISIRFNNVWIFLSWT